MIRAILGFPRSDDWESLPRWRSWPRDVSWCIRCWIIRRVAGHSMIMLNCSVDLGGDRLIVPVHPTKSALLARCIFNGPARYTVEIYSPEDR